MRTDIYYYHEPRFARGLADVCVIDGCSGLRNLAGGMNCHCE